MKACPWSQIRPFGGTLLNACRVYRDIELGTQVSERLFAMNRSDSRNYIMLSNIYSADGQWVRASKVRALTRERGVVSSPGCSFIEYKSEIHRSVVCDQTHPDSEKIHKKIGLSY